MASTMNPSPRNNKGSISLGAICDLRNTNMNASEHTYGVMEKIYLSTKSPIPMSVRKRISDQQIQASQSINGQATASTSVAGMGNDAMSSMPQQTATGVIIRQPKSLQNLLQSQTKKILQRPTRPHTVPDIVPNNSISSHTLNSGKRTTTSTFEEASPAPITYSRNTLQMESEAESDGNFGTTIADYSGGASTTNVHNIAQEQMDVDELDLASNQLIEEASSCNLIPEAKNPASTDKTTTSNVKGNNEKKRRQPVDDIPDEIPPSKASKTAKIASPRSQSSSEPTNRILIAEKNSQTPMSKEVTMDEFANKTDNERSPSPDIIPGKRVNCETLNSLSGPGTLLTPLTSFNAMDPGHTSPRSMPLVKEQTTRSVSMNPTKTIPITAKKLQKHISKEKVHTSKQRHRNSLPQPVWKDQDELEKKRLKDAEQASGRRRSGRDSLVPREWWRVSAPAAERTTTYKESEIYGAMQRVKFETQPSNLARHEKKGKGKEAQAKLDTSKAQQKATKRRGKEKGKPKPEQQVPKDKQSSAPAKGLEQTTKTKAARKTVTRKTSNPASNEKKPKSPLKPTSIPSNSKSKVASISTPIAGPSNSSSFHNSTLKRKGKKVEMEDGEAPLH